MTKPAKRLKRSTDARADVLPVGRTFPVGEILSYQISLLGILAGRARFAVLRDQLVFGEQSTPLVAIMQSDGTFGKLVKVHFRQESFVVPKTLRSRFVRMNIVSTRSRDVTLRFEHDRLRSRGVIRWPTGKRRNYATFISGETLDPISAAYWLRCQNLKLKDNIEVDVYNGRRLYSLQLVVTRRELVTAGRVTYRTLAIRGEGYLWRPSGTRTIGATPDGVSRKRRDKSLGTFWLHVTDDHKRIPVRLTFLSRYGPLEALLVGVETKR